MTERVVVARAGDVPEGGRLIVEVHGRSIGIFRLDGRFHALLNRCPHQGAELCRGDLVGLLESDRPGSYRFDPSRRLLVCPWHGWEFDVATGQSYVDPRGTRVRPFPVSVEDGRTVLRGLDESRADVAGAVGHEPGGDDRTGSRVPGPYVAETVPVAVEDDYLVVTLGRAADAWPVPGGAA